MPRRDQHQLLGAFRVTWKRPALRRYVGAYAGFAVAEWSTWIAVLVYAFDGGGATEAGLVAFAMLIPSAAFAPFAAVLGDRRSRRVVLFGALVAQAGTMALAGSMMIGDVPKVGVYTVTTVAAALITIVRPAHLSLLPSLSRSPAELTAANAATSIVQGVGAVVSPAIAALVLAAWSPGGVWLLMAAIMLASSLLVVPSRAALRRGRGSGLSGRSLLHSAREGWGRLTGQRESRLLVQLASMQTVVDGALDVLIVALAIEAFGRGDASVGLLHSARGMGGLAGALASTALIGRRRMAPAVVVGCLLIGLGIGLAGLVTAFALAVGGIAIAGSGQTYSDTAGRTLLQRLVPDDVLTRVFGAVEGARMVGLAVGALLAPLLISVTDERIATVAVAMLLPAAVLVGGSRLRSLDSTASLPERELELVRAIPMFAELSVEVIERIAAQMRRVAVDPRQAVIVEGEPGDRFYLIDSGQFAVASRGTSVAVLGPGDHFGEIALLRDVQRTATVTATTPGQLFALERAEFLEAVTGLPRAALVAQEQAQLRIDDLQRRHDG